MSACCLAGCAGRRDRLEPLNRQVLKFNDAADKYVIKPATTVYTFVVPEPIRGLVGNFFENLDTGRVIVHGVLQGKPETAHTATGRFLANSTLGIGGLFDVATGMGLEHQDEDLGQTLGVWGVKRGAYIVLPFFGPTTARDGLDIPFRIVTNPFAYAETPLRVSTSVTRGLNRRAEAERQLRRLDEAAVDRYVFLREAYLQRRRFLIHDGEVPPEDLEEGLEDDLDLLDEDSEQLDEGDLDLLGDDAEDSPPDSPDADAGDVGASSMRKSRSPRR